MPCIIQASDYAPTPQKRFLEPLHAYCALAITFEEPSSSLAPSYPQKDQARAKDASSLRNEESEQAVCTFVFSHGPWGTGALMGIYHTLVREFGKEHVNTAISSY